MDENALPVPVLEPKKGMLLMISPNWVALVFNVWRDTEGQTLVELEFIKNIFAGQPHEFRLWRDLRSMVMSKIELPLEQSLIDFDISERLRMQYQRLDVFTEKIKKEKV